MRRRPKPGSEISSEHRGFNPDPAIVKNYFTGKIVVITGDFEDFPIRDSLAALLQSHGARVTSSISKNTNVLLFGKQPGPSKMRKVDELRIAGYDIQYMQLGEAMAYLSGESSDVVE